jgi:hypothetical protein
MEHSNNYMIAVMSSGGIQIDLDGSCSDIYMAFVEGAGPTHDSRYTGKTPLGRCVFFFYSRSILLYIASTEHFSSISVTT